MYTHYLSQRIETEVQFFFQLSFHLLYRQELILEQDFYS